MRKQLLFLMALLIPMIIVVMGCPKKTPPPPPEQPKVEEPVQKPAEPETKPTPEPEVIMIKDADFKTVYFDFDKYNLVDSAKAALDLNAAILKGNPSVMLRVEGHCDERGTVEYNLALGERRAKSCRDYLTGLGIDGNRLEVISYGKERPAVMGSNEGAWARNRRGEFKVLSQ
mgnify:CR=1 FL=1